MIIPKNKVHILKAALSDAAFQPRLEGALKEEYQEILRRLIDQCTLVECGDATGLFIDILYNNYSQDHGYE